MASWIFVKFPEPSQSTRKVLEPAPTVATIKISKKEVGNLSMRITPLYDRRLFINFTLSNLLILWPVNYPPTEGRGLPALPFAIPRGKKSAEFPTGAFSYQ
jgi:hypothetical protein